MRPTSLLHPTVSLFVLAAFRGLIACVGDDPVPATGGVDAGGDANVASDGAAADVSASDGAAPPCDRTKPFGAPVLVAEVNSPFDETSARLSSDELTIYFGSTRPVPPDGGRGAELFFAHRTSVDLPFGEPQPLANVNSDSNDTHPMVSADGLTLFFSSDRQEGDAAAMLTLFVATRGAPGSPAVSPFSNPTRLVALAGPNQQSTPYLTADGKELWYASADDGGQRLHLHRSVGPTFNGGAIVAELDTPNASQRFPVLSADGLTIYFGSDRETSAGASDIWYAKRATTAAAFQPPVSASTLNALLNAGGLDDPTWISPDDCRLYLVSDREDPTKRNVYVATRPK